MKILNTGNTILDTLKFENEKILYKKQHAERVFETYSFLNREFSEMLVFDIYDEIEKIYASQTTENDCLRITFLEDNVYEYAAEVRQIEKLDSPIKLFAVKEEYNFTGRDSHKWADRSRWQNLSVRLRPGADDLLVINKKNEMVETSRCNLFLYDKVNDEVYTPPLRSGCLNGVFRRFVLSEKQIEIPGQGFKKIVKQDMPSSLVDLIREKSNQRYFLFTGNSIRGLMPAMILND